MFLNRYVYMTGGNREAAEYSGVNVRMILSAVMIISAFCSVSVRKEGESFEAVTGWGLSGSNQV